MARTARGTCANCARKRVLTDGRCAECTATPTAPQEAPVNAPTELAAPAPAATTSEAVAALAAATGESLERITVRTADWARFISQGAVVHITYRRWRSECRATLDDLGLEPELPRFSDETDAAYNTRVKEARAATLRVLNLPAWRLLPPELVKRAEAIEVRGRTWLEDTGYRTFWGWWLHTRQYAAWLARHREHMAAYEALGDEITADWDAIQARVRADLMGEGRQAYARARASAAYRAGLLTLPDSAEEFAESFVARVCAKVPTAEGFRARWGTSYTCELIPVAAQVAADEVQARRIRLDAVTAEMAADIRRTEAARAAEGVQRFVADIQSAIRAEVYDVVTDALDTLQTGKGRLPGGTATKLRNLCERVSTAVFWDDPDLEARRAELQAALAVPAAERSTEAVQGALRALGAEARIVLLELDRTGERRARPDLGLGDDLGALAVTARRARPALDLGAPLAPEMPPVTPQARKGRRIRTEPMQVAS